MKRIPFNLEVRGSIPFQVGIVDSPPLYDEMTHWTDFFDFGVYFVSEKLGLIHSMSNQVNLIWDLWCTETLNNYCFPFLKCARLDTWRRLGHKIHFRISGNIVSRPFSVQYSLRQWNMTRIHKHPYSTFFWVNHETVWNYLLPHLGLLGLRLRIFWFPIIDDILFLHTFFVVVLAIHEFASSYLEFCVNGRLWIQM